jgi:hypothetical protein
MVPLTIAGGGEGRAKAAPAGAVNPPREAPDAERRAAEWVLSLQGTVRVRVTGEEKEIGPDGNLPAERFQLLGIGLFANPGVTDAGLVHLKSLTNLRGLDLNATRVTDAGMLHLKGLSNLTMLNLMSTRISGEGFVHLKGLTNITVLFLANSWVGDSGLTHLEGLSNLKQLGLENTRVSDAGLVHLQRLKRLENLHLPKTKVTKVGVAALRKALPACRIHTDPLIEAATPKEATITKPTRTLSPALLKLTPGSLQGRTGPMRQELLKEGGGSDKTEAAVAAGLKWFAKHQRADGSWTIEGQKAYIGATGLGLLPLLGAGHTHKQGGYVKTVNAGLNYLLRKQNLDGSFATGGMYEQGIATIAVCEAFGMSKDQRLRRPAQRAIDYLVAAQHAGGGWRYEPRQPGDTSVTGWQFMALKTGEMAGLKVPAKTFQRISLFLDGVTTPDGGYGYTDPRTTTPSLTAVGVVCRQYMGWKPERVELKRGIDILKMHPPPTGGKTVYYYYATQAMRHFGGEEWVSWNSKMQELLLESQVDGSWSPNMDELGKQGGRVMVTSLSLLILEVYYRHVPLFLAETKNGEQGPKK